MAPISQHLSFCFYRKFCAADGGCRAPNRTAVAEENQISTGAATLLRISKHAPSPTVTMSTLLSALKIIIHSGIWLAQRRDLKWHADINKVG
jgi:hypothetical protein